ncbi:hypothetical protein POTOM_036943 [Populus tomentosa]|uniref:AMP-dependent synthetase/ligase domain-containing protein n=1 Tax=Populus tomentosa TaxID=118781 RepID=A0A8X7Z0M5_POPTO|nr:hypothetical protein POTOM_036943 [Populus tomentosa]
MPAEELWTGIITEKEADDAQSKSDTTSYVLSQFPHPDHAETKVALVDLATNQQVTYAQLHRSIHALASGLYNGLGVRKAPEEVPKLVENGMPTLVTTRESNDDSLSVKELIECGGPLELPQVRITQSDTAAILYSSGTTGTSKGVIFTRSNFIAIMTLLKWSVYASSSQNDIFLCFVPIFHIYGLVFFGLGLFCAGITTVLMQRFDFQPMLDAVQAYKINNIPAVPPVLLGLVKHANEIKCVLSSLRRVGSGAA